jgi:hypothetical protein
VLIAIRQDPRQIVALEKIAAATERIANTLDKLDQSQGGIVRTVSFTYNGKTFKSKGGEIMVELKATEVPGTGTLNFAFADSEGNPTEVDSVSGLVASDPTIVDSVELAADGKSAKVHVTNKVGASQMTLEAIENGAPKTFVDVLSVVPGDAASANMTMTGFTPD